MNKKEINSPWMTANFVVWLCGVGCVALLLFLGHYLWRVFSRRARSRTGLATTLYKEANV